MNRNMHPERKRGGPSGRQEAIVEALGQARSTVKVGRDGKVQQQFDLRENDVCLFLLKKIGTY